MVVNPTNTYVEGIFDYLGIFFWECKGLMGLSWILIGFKL